MQKNYLRGLHMAIEVEKKFLLTEHQRRKLITGAKLIAEKVIRDVYYDDSDWSLSTKDIFLRERDGSWELKVGAAGQSPHGRRSINQYEEITDSKEILSRLELATTRNIAETLSSAGLTPFAKLTTHRTKYQRDGFVIDVDSVKFPEGDGYDLVEIELMGDDAEESKRRIDAFAAEIGLPTEPVRGKLQEYCVRHQPEHIIAMKKAGLVVEK
jgi:adenylate cyclase class IV